MNRQIVVPFRGEGAGVDILTWGQRASWASMVYNGGIPEWTGGIMPLSDETTTRDIATLLGFIMSRHQTLRTRFRVADDGTPLQVVSDAGEVALDVIEADDAADPAEVAAAEQTRLEAASWDMHTDWPVRMAVIEQRGKAVHFVALYSHLVIDGYGFDVLVADLANLDYATGRQLAPVGGVQPLEQARIQRTPSALRQSKATLRRWEPQLRTIEPRRFPDSGDHRDPRYWEASYTSPATYLALPFIAERTKIHSSAILLAAYAVMIARISGNPSSTIRELVSNRFRPGFGESVSAVMQSALCVINTGDVSFDEAVSRAFKTQVAAGVRGYYNPPELWEMIDRVSEERGVEFDLMCYFNDRRRTMSQPPVDRQITHAHVLDALSRSSLRWGKRSNIPDATCYLHINGAPDTIDYTLLVDTHSVSPADMERCLRGIEALVVEAAFDATVSTDVRSSSVPA